MSKIRFLAAAGLLLLLGACAGEPAEAPPVASLQSAAPAASATLSADDQRPLIPSDATEADVKALARPWGVCMAKQVPQFKVEDAHFFIWKGIPETDPELGPAIRACRAKQPESAEDRLQRTDLPAFKDNQREWYRCAEEQGYKLTTPDPETGQFGLTEIGPNGDAGSPKFIECQQRAFAD